MKKIKIEFSNERIIPVGDLSVVGAILGKSDFAQKCNRMDVTPFDNSKTKKEGVSRTYKGFDGYAPIMAYLGTEGYLINAKLREGKQHCQCDTPAFFAGNHFPLPSDYRCPFVGSSGLGKRFCRKYRNPSGNGMLFYHQKESASGEPGGLVGHGKRKFLEYFYSTGRKSGIHRQ